MAYLGWPF